MSNIKDFAFGEVLTAPSPTTTGTTLTLLSGHGARMPETPFYAVTYPQGVIPSLDTAEKVQVTDVTGDTVTIVRARGETTAKSIAAGWFFVNSIFADDILNTSFITNETPGGAINGSNTAFTTASAYATGSLEVFLNGQKLVRGASDDYTETTSGFTMVFAPATGDKLRVNYRVSSSGYSVGTNSFVSDEVPTGSVNGSNTAFTTLRPYIAGTLEVFINGLKQARTTHVTETTPSTGAFTLDTAPTSGDIVRVNYQFNLNPSGNADTVDGNHADDLAPVGAGMDYWGDTLPSANWMWAAGQAISRTAYPTLFARLGTTHGAGDGSTTFNLPDKRGRVSAGQDDMGGTSANRLTGLSGGVDGDVLGAVGGAETHTLTIAQMPAHDHPLAAGGPNVGQYVAPAQPTGTSSQLYDGYIGPRGGSGAHNNVQPTIICNYIIKVA